MTLQDPHGLTTLAAASAPPASASAQALPSEPIALADGRVTVSGDVSAGYRRRRSRLLQLHRLRALGAAAVPRRRDGGGQGRRRTSRCSARSAAKTSTRVRPYALYLRIRPWTTRDFDIQVGRVPPTFGAFARRTYANDNPLIGYPLAYQYLTSLRPDAVPASADELLRMRSRGWLVRYSLGNPTSGAGRPARQRVPLGHRRAGARHGRHAERDGGGDRRHGLEPAVLRRQPRPAAGRTRRAAPGRRPDPRRLGRARPVRQRRRRRAPRSATVTTATSRRPPGAATPSTRATTTCCASRRSSATGGCRSRRRRRSAALQTPLDARVDVGRRTLQASARTSTSRRAFDHLGFSDLTGTTGDAAVGRAGDAVRDRRRLFDPAQPAAEGVHPAQRSRRRPCCRRSRTWSRRSWCSGSDAET